MPTDNDRLLLIARLTELADAFIDFNPEFLSLIRAVAGQEPAALSSPLPTVEEMRTLRDEGKIAAIRQHRARTGLGLKESKDAVEAAGASLGLLGADGKSLPDRTTIHAARIDRDDDF